MTTWNAPAQPVIVDARPSRGGILLAMLLCLGLGTVAVVSAFAGGVSGGTGTAIIAGVLGGLFLLIGLALALSWRTMMRPHQLVFEGPGLRWNDPRGRSWAVAWPELAGVGIHTHTRPDLRTASRPIQPTVTVTVVLHPADPLFAQRHPELAHLRREQDQREYYGVPLGPAPERVPAIDHGLRTFAPRLYRGVAETGPEL